MSAGPDACARLPQVEQFLQEPFLSPFITALSRPLVTDIVRNAFADIRRSDSFRQQGIDPDVLRRRVEKACSKVMRQRHAKVINATGTVIHTNLGRSPIDRELWDSVADVNTGYCNLEIALAHGKRGQRKGLVAELLSQLTGADDALVVNNNAASVYLLLNELAKGKEVIVSRGEQIQIGGGFRIPDILALSGAKLVEVGTTNITTAQDYLDAVTDDTAMVLMVHTSNFVVRGFTQSPEPKELAKKLPDHVMLVVDQGSGLTTEGFAAEETPVASYVKAGADLVCFSGDKIIGGPQSGMIVGRKDLVCRLEKNPLMRAFRPGRIVYSLLEELLVRKLNRTSTGMGVSEKAHAEPDAVRQRAERVAAMADNVMRIVPSQMIVGGGTLPDEFYPSWAVELTAAAGKKVQKLVDDLRNMPVAVIAVIRNDRVHLDMTTVLPGDMECLEQQLRTYLTQEGLA